MIRSLGKLSGWHSHSVVEVKSKFGAEFRRFSLNCYEPGVFKDFHQFILNLHQLFATKIYISYADVHGDLLPINNDYNFYKAVSTAQPLLRIFIQLQEELDQGNIISKCVTRRKKSTITVSADVSRRGHVQIGSPQNFRPVSSIIDVDILPECHRRVRLYHQGSDRPLGFFIRDGITFIVTPHGLEKVPGIFISRIVPGGLAESCGLLAINDQILEVNGIEVIGKTLDQVTDMMIANSRNLIVTVKPANQTKSIRNPIISRNPELQLDGKGSISYPGLPIIMQAYDWMRNDSVSDDDSDMVVDNTVKLSSQCSSASPSSQKSIHNHHRNGHPYSQELCHSQPCLNFTANAGPSISLQREQSSRQHYQGNPAFRQRTSSTFDILGALSPDLQQRLMIPQWAMEEDGTAITL
ncbi:par-6 family cell polarity regulator gamma a isoform X1 [Tachysurus vachellii]|uniref:par-6 family cell polarity regulator gamma a isoform X1 n=1 Tax=Tachysurus vachellii TaxID=175792 RepID=UPI00296AA411|nr:par-6 family cell polarity regulator gamma a isoform X1 [Tachysurus vachellii]